MCFILNHKIRNFVLSCAFTEWRRSSVAWKFNQVNVTVRKCLFHWPSLFAMNIIIPPDDRSVCFSSTVLRSFFSFSMTPGTSTASSLGLCRKLFFWYFRYPEPIPSVPVEDFTSICVLLLEVGVFFYIVYVYNVHNWMSTWCVLHALEQQRNWPSDAKNMAMCVLFATKLDICGKNRSSDLLLIFIQLAPCQLCSLSFASQLCRMQR